MPPSAAIKDTRSRKARRAVGCSACKAIPHRESMPNDNLNLNLRSRSSLKRMAQKTEQPRWIAGVEPSKELLAMDGTQILDYECREQPGKLRELISAYKSDEEIHAQLRTMSDIAAKSAAPVS